jgi:uncharacterized phage protein gp47/JayE
MTFGLTPEGFNTPRLADEKQALENAFIAEFGDVNTDPQSVCGQLIGIFAKAYADLWENLDDVYLSEYPNSASGISLDNVVQLNGITRLPATQTLVVATVSGLEGTYIPINSLASLPTTGDTFFANVGGTISRTNADIVKIQVTSVTTQAYTILLNGSVFTYSLPVITFSNVGPIFVTSNSIKVTINGVTLAAVPYNTSSNQTLTDVASAIQAFSSGTVCTAVATPTNVITITPLSGKSVTINSISITGGATQASNVITFIAPANQNAITAQLKLIANAGSPPWNVVDNMDGTITVNATNVSVPFSANAGINLEIIYQASPITFLAENFGPIPAPIGTLTNIITPLAGWNTITNLVAGVLGRVTETDAELRIRRQNSIKLLGSATVEAITAGLLQKVPGVTSATVFENVTLQQEPILVVFPLPFTSGDTITITYNTVSNFSVSFTTDQATTMGLIVAQFELIPQVLSASYGGTGNQTVTVNIIQATVLTINSAVVTGTAQTASIKGGRPPKSFEAVVEGGSDQAVAEQIWLTKPAGIETFGNVNSGNGITIIDSQGNSQVIFFSRPTEIFIWVQVALTLYSEETFPSDGTQQVALAILNYGNSLGVGIDVLFQRVLAQIFTVPGIASGNMVIASTATATDSPSFGTSDIIIEESEISAWDLSRILVTVV